MPCSCLQFLSDTDIHGRLTLIPKATAAMELHESCLKPNLSLCNPLAIKLF